MKARFSQLLALILGAYIGLLSTITHRMHGEWASVLIPWGIGIGVLSLGLAAMVVARRRERIVPFLLGWFLTIALGLGVFGRGYLIALDVWGLSFLVLSLGALMLSILRSPR